LVFLVGVLLLLLLLLRVCVLAVPLRFEFVVDDYPSVVQ